MSMAGNNRVMLRSFGEHTRAFADGAGSPRHFLEQSLERLEAVEPEIGAF